MENNDFSSVTPVIPGNERYRDACLRGYKRSAVAARALKKKKQRRSGAMSKVYAGFDFLNCNGFHTKLVSVRHGITWAITSSSDVILSSVVCIVNRERASATLSWLFW